MTHVLSANVNAFRPTSIVTRNSSLIFSETKLVLCGFHGRGFCLKFLFQNEDLVKTSSSIPVWKQKVRPLVKVMSANA